MERGYRKIVVLLMMSAFIIAGMLVFNAMTTTRFNKTIKVVIVDNNNQVLFDESVETRSETLDEVLKSLDKDGKIKFTYGGNEDGAKIEGLGTTKIIKEVPDKNLYWTHTSTNNASCLEAGACGVIDKLTIHDGDEFVFTLVQK